MCGPALKSLLNLLQYCFCGLCFSFLITRYVRSYSPTRYWTHTLCIGRQILNHWTERKVPPISLINFFFFFLQGTKFHWFLKQHCKVEIIDFILQVIQLRYKELKLFFQRYKTTVHRTTIWAQACLSLKTHILNCYIIP